jgi:hypothetical protein
VRKRSQEACQQAWIFDEQDFLVAMQIDKAQFTVKRVCRLVSDLERSVLSIMLSRPYDWARSLQSDIFAIERCVTVLFKVCIALAAVQGLFTAGRLYRQQGQGPTFCLIKNLNDVRFVLLRMLDASAGRKQSRASCSDSADFQEECRRD